MKTVLVLNGPNLNLLGTREPAVYGSQSLADVEALCVKACAAHDLTLDFRQSNHEGVLIDAIHEAGRAQAAGTLAGVVLNAGAYTHTSVALLYFSRRQGRDGRVWRSRLCVGDCRPGSVGSRINTVRH